MFHRLIKNRMGKVALFAAATLFAIPAFAHPGHDGASFSTGFFHPLLGIDHLLAMIAVGIWAAQSRKSAVWVLPVVFPLMMVVGAALAVAGVHFPGVESSIAGSVAILGLLIAFAVKMPLWAATLVVSAFALVHGHAHGTELPANASALTYGAGFVLATALLHVTGLAFSLVGDKVAARNAMRIIGAGVAATGMYLFTIA
jgi:urease accessory protein